VKGLFNYRGKLLPLLDAALLLGHTPGDIRMTARILVVRTDGSAKGDDENQAGILVERVLGSEQVDFEDRSGHASVHASEARFLGPVALTPDGTVQLIDSSGIPVP
jgi:chemotaxis-related protein WspB